MTPFGPPTNLDTSSQGIPGLISQAMRGAKPDLKPPMALPRTIINKTSQFATQFGKDIKQGVGGALDLIGRGVREKATQTGKFLFDQSLYGKVHKMKSGTDEEKEMAKEDIVSGFSMGAAEEGAIVGKAVKPVVKEAAEAVSKKFASGFNEFIDDVLGPGRLRGQPDPLPSDEIIEELKKFVPNKVVTLYKGGKGIDTSQPYSSWTYDRSIAESYAQDGGHVISRKVHPDEILLDTTMFPSGYNTDFLSSSGNALDYEREVLVKNMEHPQWKTSKTFATAEKATPVFEGLKDLSLTTLEKLKGRSTVSKQFVEDLAKAPDLKQGERDILNRVLADVKGKDINVPEFADKVRTELLPLKVAKDEQRITRQMLEDPNYDEYFGGSTTRYENVALPSEVRGDIENYAEHVYESPVKTEAGNVHFGRDVPNYFGHTRVEDIPNDTRRVIEVQSDLYQKGNLEKESLTFASRKLQNLPEKVLWKGEEHTLLTGRGPLQVMGELPSNARIKSSDGNVKAVDFGALAKENSALFEDTARNADISKLKQYGNPTAHFRMIREEVKRASQDGKKKLLFPTGETAMKIEGLGGINTRWRTAGNVNILKPENLKVGEVINSNGQGDWIITDVLGDGKFKAVPKTSLLNKADVKGPLEGWIEVGDSFAPPSRFESFDISGSVDKDNPIYKFYDKEVAKYLKSKYKAKPVTDAQGVTWMEMDITPDMAKEPVLAFSMVPIGGSMMFRDLDDGQKEERLKARIPPVIKTLPSQKP